MSSLNQEAGGEAIPNNSGAGVVEAAANAMLEDPENGAEAGTPGRAISRRGEEARGGFVLRAKSEDMPARRRSLVERSGMKTLVQVRIICVEGHHAGISEGHSWSLKQLACSLHISLKVEQKLYSNNGCVMRIWFGIIKKRV